MTHVQSALCNIPVRLKFAIHILHLFMEEGTVTHTNKRYIQIFSIDQFHYISRFLSHPENPMSMTSRNQHARGDICRSPLQIMVARKKLFRGTNTGVQKQEGAKTSGTRE